MNEIFQNCVPPAKKSIQLPFTKEGPALKTLRHVQHALEIVGLFTLHRLNVQLKLGSNSIINTFLFMIQES
jgi:hypothetical protein